MLHNCVILELRKRANTYLFLPTGPASVLPCFCILPVRPPNIPSVDLTRSQADDDGDLKLQRPHEHPDLTHRKEPFSMSTVVHMSTEANKASVRRFYDEVFNKKNRAAIDEFIDPNHVDHAAPPGTPGGLKGVKQTLNMYLTAFPDLHFTVEDIIAEGDKVVTRLTCRGTQQGAFMGIPPTGKQATVMAIDINRFAGGKSVEHWLNMDTLGLLQQLGAIPAPGQ